MLKSTRSGKDSQSKFDGTEEDPTYLPNASYEEDVGSMASLAQPTQALQRADIHTFEKTVLTSAELLYIICIRNANALTFETFNERPQA